MLQRVLVNVFTSLTRAWHGRGWGDARNRLRSALDRYAKGNYAEACMLCEAALALEPDLADASCLLGVLACRGGDADSGVRAIERALALSPGNTWYLAALADARLLQQRPGDAQALYSRAFPLEAADLAGLTDAGLPWKRTHPDWIGGLLQVTLPLSLPHLDATHKGQLPADEVEAGHLLNWALALVSQRRVRQAIFLLQQAVMRDRRLGYGHAALALLHTLNRDWGPALTAAHVARSLGAEAFRGSNDLCVLAAQFGTGIAYSELDPVFDWSPLTASAEAGSGHLDRLPPVEGVPYPRFPENILVYFIACDPRYFLEYGIALACSIRDSTERDAIHFHIYNPTPELWSALHELRSRLTPLMLSVTWESVDFDRFGGKSAYCSFARFSRLYQLLLDTSADLRVVMLDADSLVRGDPAPALARGREIGLAHAGDEPLWHQYLAGFTAFRASAAATRFLHELSNFLATNLAAGCARAYLDQIALYACAHRRNAATVQVIDHLPVGVFCDTLFGESALIWSVTQNKGVDSPFDRARRSILERYNQPVFSSASLATGDSPIGYRPASR